MNGASAGKGFGVAKLIGDAPLDHLGKLRMLGRVTLG
jgi:hypothetical protein